MKSMIFSNTLKLKLILLFYYDEFIVCKPVSMSFDVYFYLLLTLLYFLKFVL